MFDLGFIWRFGGVTGGFGRFGGLEFGFGGLGF